MAEATAIIDGVFENERTSANGPFTSYDVKAGGIKYQTTKDAIGLKAKALKGQTAKIVYTETQRGQYTNRTIQSVEGVEGAPRVEKQRSKEEVRRTEAFKIAATLGPEDLAQLVEVGDAIANVLASTGQEAPEEKQF